jgi:Replication-relaxation
VWRSYLTKKKYIWQAEVSAAALRQVNEGPPGRNRLVFGLSRTGKQFLADLQVEPDPRALELLVARDVRGAAPNQDQLEHDLQVTWWCMSMVEGLRLIPWCSSVYLQTEYRSSKTQRVDAILMARFDPYRHRENLDAIPWYDGKPIKEHEFEIRWALELDNSTESVRVLVDKFVMYRDMHARGSYHKLFQGEMILVLMVQTPERAGYLAAEFLRAWPEG